MHYCRETTKLGTRLRDCAERSERELYRPPSGRPRVSTPATYRSGTPRGQHPVIALWHAHLRGLATVMHEIYGLNVYELLDTKFKVGTVCRFRVRKYLFQRTPFPGFGESSGYP